MGPVDLVVLVAAVLVVLRREQAVLLPAVLPQVVLRLVVLHRERAVRQSRRRSNESFSLTTRKSMA